MEDRFLQILGSANVTLDGEPVKSDIIIRNIGALFIPKFDTGRLSLNANPAEPVEAIMEVNGVDLFLDIEKLFSNSPASKAGILPGDELAKINGKMHHFSDYCDFLNHFELEPAEEIQLELVRNGEPFKVKLRKEKIL
ncbi:MAG: hypothetical protein H6573_02415 [Lewinellaceae bacterium]|nr:hypothetical protein [Lewinellaceae bacterium]